VAKLVEVFISITPSKDRNYSEPAANRQCGELPSIAATKIEGKQK
jgi:hypothetical protein